MTTTTAWLTVAVIYLWLVGGVFFIAGCSQSGHIKHTRTRVLAMAIWPLVGFYAMLTTAKR